MTLIDKLYKIWESKTITVKFLSLVISIFSLFSLAIILYVYLIAEKSMAQRVMINQQKELNTQIEYVNNQLKQLELSSINWALRIKGEIEDVLKDEEELNYVNTETVRKDLASLEIGNLLIQEVFIYVDARVPYSIKTGENWKENNNQQDRFFFKNFDKNNGVSWKRIDTSSGSKLIFSYRLSNQNSEIQKNLIIIINNQEFNNMIASSGYNNGESIILKDGNNYIFGSSESMVNHLNETLQKIDRSSNNIIKVMGRDYLYYKKEAELISDTWTYIMFKPVDSIAAQFIDIFNNIIIWIIFFTLLIIAVIWISIRKLYSPIQRLFHIVEVPSAIKNMSDIEYVISKWEEMKFNKSELEQKINHNNQLLVENFFKQLLQNEQVEENNFIKNKLNDLGWNLENKRVILVNFLLTDILSKDINVSEDENLCYYMSENIIKEKLLEIYKHTHSTLTAMTFNGILSMILINEENCMREKEQLINLTNSILKQINRFVGRHMVITISNEFDDYVHIPNIYRKMVEFRSVRKVEDVNVILDMAQAPKDISKDIYTYPVEFEKDIIQGIYLNDEDAVLQGLNNFEKSIKAQKIRTEQMRLTFLQMLNSLRYEVIQMGFVSEQVIKDIDSIFLELNTSEYMEQAKSLIWINILKPLLDNRKQNNIGQEKNYINKVLYFMRNHYQEENFSLEWCARQVGVDEFVLSRIFKKNMGINFIDYLTKTRLDKAMELLVTTNYPVTTIAQMIGYQSNYFSRIFKSKIGKTPGEYRKKNQIQGAEKC